ncbi:MAG: CHASE2 domain-containing protein [Myxococcaceae bacterium]|nr:CHASE2 domain-containing protein [Myxococcaceae bacterium]
MQSARLQSAGRRFLRILGFSLLQAVLLGCAFGWLTSVRVARTEREEEGVERLPVHQQLSDRLERLELAFYDWRARELGRVSERPEEVVPIVIDEETLANARETARSELAMQPWPREVLGHLVARLLEEGASRVLLDVPLANASPHRPQGGPSGPLADEERMQGLLAERPGASQLGFTWSLQSVVPPAGRPGPSFVVLVDVRPSVERAQETVRRLLSEGHRAFVVPDGRSVQVLADVGSEAEGRALQKLLGAGLDAPPRPFLPADRAYEVRAQDLLLQLAAVEVEGLEPESLFQVRSLEHPLVPLLGRHSAFGSVRLVPDTDGRVRGVPHLVGLRDGEGRLRILPSLPLAAAMAEAGSRRLRYRDGLLEVGDRYRVPMGPDGVSLLRWDAPEPGRDSRGTLAHQVNAWRVLTNLQDVAGGMPARYRNGLEGRVALVMRAGRAGGQTVATPSGEQVQEGAVLGQALVNLLRSDGVRRASPRTDLLATMALTFLGAFLSLAATRAVKSTGGAVAYFLLALLLGAGYVAFARHVFIEQRLWLAVAGPLLAMAATFALTTVYALRTEREFAELLTGALGRYVSPEVLHRVRRDVSLLRPERRPMTVFFSDLEGFTRIAEQLPPETVVTLLNEYLGAMTQAVRETGGQVDKYMGDALMAFWGAPVRSPHHAERACEAALRMRTLLLERQEAWEWRFGCRLQFRAGLNSGDVLVGDMGSAAKSAYSVLGRAVNLAAHLEREAHVYGSYLLVGEETARMAGEGFVFRELDRLRLPGHEVPVRIHELVARRKDLTPELAARLGQWSAALDAYHQRDFEAALRLFQESHEAHVDPAAALYVQRCEALLACPPADGWDGVFTAAAAAG